MYKYILESAGNIDWMAIGPLVFFFVFFVAISYMAITSKKSFIDKMGNMPFDDSTVQTNNDNK